MSLQNNVIIVGAGTAGLICALYFKRYFPQCTVNVVKSSSVGIVGVGEGSTEHWDQFLMDCDIDYQELIVETDATLKIGILFKDWGPKGSQYMHAITDHAGRSHFATLEKYNKAILTDQTSHPFILSTEFKEIFSKNRVIISNDLKPANQYHFDTFKLNDFLIKKCQEREINIIDAVVKDITLTPQGDINTLITEDNTTIIGDFFVDCTGFKRVLMSKLGAKWVSYSKYLPMNHAITLATDLPTDKNIETYTTTTALSSGWAWKIPTQTRYGNGYVFNDNFINSNQALDEFNAHLNTSYKEPSKDIKFEAGKIDKFWVKNCVCMGLASGFSEPLEAQSIGLSILQSSFLTQTYAAWKVDTKASMLYNSTMDRIYNNIIDYLQVHYIIKRNDSEFWKTNNFTLTDFNKETKTLFSYGLMPPEHFHTYDMFKAHNFYQVYYGVGLLTRENLLTQSSLLPKEHHEEALKVFLNVNTKSFNSMKHWDYLKLIKENYSS